MNLFKRIAHEFRAHRELNVSERTRRERSQFANRVSGESLADFIKNGGWWVVTGFTSRGKPSLRFIYNGRR